MVVGPRILFFLLLVTNLLTACSSERSGGGVFKYKNWKFKSITEELKSADLQCENPEACPNSVGMILSVAEKGTAYTSLQQCTGFLVAENVVATNEHCLPKHLKSGGASCAEDMAIRFLGGGQSIFPCEKVLYFSKANQSFGPDFAFFEIAPAKGHQSILISRRGLLDRSQLTNVAVTPTSKARAAGRLQVRSCRLILNSLLNPFGASPWSTTGTSLDCQAIEGQSGSPVLNAKGEAIGVLQAYATEYFRDSIASRMGERGVKIPQKLPPHFIFTNFSCVRDPVTGQGPDPRCSKARDLDFLKCGIEPATARESLARATGDWVKSLPKQLGYSLVFDTQSNSYTALPFCVALEPQEKSWFFHDPSPSQTDLHLPPAPLTLEFSPQMSADADLRISPLVSVTAKSTETLPLHFRFDPNGPAWHSTIRLPAVGQTSFLFQDFEWQKLSLPPCTPDDLKNKNLARSVRKKDGSIVSVEQYDREIFEEFESYKPLCSPPISL